VSERRRAEHRRSAHPALVVVERVHRGGVETAFASVLHVLRGVHDRLDGPLAVVLRGAAVTAAVPGAPVRSAVGGAPVALPDPAGDLAALHAAGAALHAVAEDCARHGVDPAALVPGVVPLAAADLPDLWHRARRVWFL
jgi:hypothetical protein